MKVISHQTVGDVHTLRVDDLDSKRFAQVAKAVQPLGIELVKKRRWLGLASADLVIKGAAPDVRRAVLEALGGPTAASHVSAEVGQSIYRRGTVTSATDIVRGLVQATADREANAPLAKRCVRRLITSIAHLKPHQRNCGIKFIFIGESILSTPWDNPSFDEETRQMLNARFKGFQVEQLKFSGTVGEFLRCSVRFGNGSHSNADGEIPATSSYCV